MASSNVDSRRFRQSASLWTAFFTQQNKKRYAREDETLEARQPPDRGRPPTTNDIIDIFLHDRCGIDIDRYLYRDVQIASFLKDVGIEALRDGANRISTPRCLIDDRNNASTTRTNLEGSCRPPKGPLDARAFYLELVKKVHIGL